MINFLKYKFIYLAISLSIIIPGSISLFRFGLRPSIDFTGGTVVEYHFSPEIDQPKIEALLLGKFKLEAIEKTQQGNFLLKLPPLDSQKTLELKTFLSRLGQMPTELSFETRGPTLGKELLKKTIIGLFLATILILSYIAYAFKNIKFGVCATLATLHDSLVILGLFSIFGAKFGVEVDALFVTALLTVLSFSVHDTIVVFDRIREKQKNLHRSDEETLNSAINETIVRSLNNSLTVIFMLTALLLLGGESLRWFVAALLIGTISGVYSSPFVATPLLLLWDKVFNPK